MKKTDLKPWKARDGKVFHGFSEDYFSRLLKIGSHFYCYYSGSSKRPGFAQCSIKHLIIGIVIFSAVKNITLMF